MLQNTFCHLSGVGPKTEQRLWKIGVLTWDDFFEAGHLPVFTSKTAAWREELVFSSERLDADDAEYFGTLLDAGEAWRLFPEFSEDVVYLDIETDGTRASKITSIATYGRGEARTYVQGRNLGDFARDIEGYKLLVTYNGRCFDAPVIEQQLNAPLPKAHIDLRNVLGRVGIKGGLKKCEKQVGLDREELDGVDGYFAVLLWREFSRYGREAVLETLLAYNMADVLSLEVLLAHAVNRAVAETPFADDYAMDIPDMGENPHEADPRVLAKLIKKYRLRRTATCG